METIHKSGNLDVSLSIVVLQRKHIMEIFGQIEYVNVPRDRAVTVVASVSVAAGPFEHFDGLLSALAVLDDRCRVRRGVHLAGAGIEVGP